MPAITSKLKRAHAALCFERAFPADTGTYRKASAELRRFTDQISAIPRAAGPELWDTGIAGTPIHYGFSFAVAQWLARKTPGTVTIDWDAIDKTECLDELLTHLLLPSEDEYFDSGYVSSREWIDMARAGCAGTDFDWLLAQLADKRLRKFWSQLYDAADLPLAWKLGKCRFSKSRNTYATGHPKIRSTGMRPRPRSPKQEIQRPLGSIARLSTRNGARLIDVAMASLAVRHRETYHFNYANPAEVYLADVGEGVSIAVFGLLAEHRFPLECTMGFLILSNGMPIGYGGSSILFRQVNTGINIFDEYRASEASYLWAQVMRVYHALVGSTRFIANPYQFGAENSEGLKSGAFWFYYRLGYRPVSAEIRKLAQREAAKIRRNRKYPNNLKTLRKLASCDMHLMLPGARASDLFAEHWIETSSMMATEVLGASGRATRNDAANDIAAKLARELGLKSLQRWSAAERRAFNNIAPIVAVTDVENWSSDARRKMRELLRAKGGDSEARYARLLCEHNEFLASLQKACLRADFS